MKKQIVIATYGWVFVGLRDADPNRNFVKLTDASVIRNWGTQYGLGEIALNGPTPKTVLDPCGFVELPLTSVVAVIDCKE